MIIVTAMVTPIPSGHYPLVVQQKMVTFLGTPRHAAQLWQLHTAVGLLERNRYKATQQDDTYHKVHYYTVCNFCVCSVN
jgi:hypothetical protein